MNQASEAARLERLLSAPFAVLMMVPPDSWGLRGDPLLWDEMRVKLAPRPIPETAPALAYTVADAFHAITGKPIHGTPEPFNVERFAREGQSSGFVDPEWWRTTALPLFEERRALHRKDFESVKLQMKADLRKLRLPAAAKAQFTADAAALAADFAAAERGLGEKLPKGEPKRVDTASALLFKLSKQLESITPHSRRQLLLQALHNESGHSALLALATDDHPHTHEAADAVVAVIMGAGEAQKLFIGSRWRPPLERRDAALRRLVPKLACAWRAHFDREPRTTPGAQFVAVVAGTWQALTGDDAGLSPEAVNRAMQREP